MLPVLLLIILREVASLRTAQLKGNLVFETEQQSTVTINPHYIQFNRQFDLSNIQTAINLLTNYTESYSQYCNDIQKDRKRVYDMFQANAMYFAGKTVCRNNHGFLPEIRTEAEAERLMELMKLINIKETPAGVTISNNSLIYLRTGQPNLFKSYRYCKECKIINHFIPPDSKRKTVLVYAYDETNVLHIKESKCYTDSCESSPIICTKGTEFDSSILTTLASHSCVRDTEYMQQTNKFLQQEYDSFVDATDTVMKRRRRFAPPRRRKRMIPAIPLITGGMIGGGFMSTAISGINPFTFIGEMVGGVFGLATARDLRMTQEMIKKVSFELDKVKLNQQTIVEAINGMMAHSTRLEKLIRFQTHDIAVIYGELDSKIAMRYLQSVIQMTLLKIHASMVAARQFKPSPYVFGQKDLRDLTSDPRYFKNKMTTQLEDVATALIVVDNKFTFLIAVPLKEEKSQYNTYKIRQLPIFNNNKTYQATIANPYYAINMNTNEYIPLTDADYSGCSQRPMCATQQPIFTITSKSPCEISSFVFSRQVCPLEIAHPAGPSFLNYGNTTFYSVPEKLIVNVRCSINGQSLSRHENIDGIGSFQAHTGCTTQVLEQAQIRPIHVAEIHDLEGNSVFGVLKQFDFSSIQYPKEPDQNTTTQKPITILEVSSFSEGLQLLFDVQTNSTDVARIFLGITIFIIFFLLIYLCVPPFKLWFNDCCSFTKPHKYWGQKYINVPQFVKIHKPSSHLHERMQHFCTRIRNLFTRTSAYNTNSKTSTSNPCNAEIFHDFQQPIITNSMYPNINLNNV